MPDSGAGDGGFLMLNTILYCRSFDDTVRFYQRTLGLASRHMTDWFVEFEVAPGAYISVADDQRTRVKSASGGGLTLALQVADATAMRSLLRERGLEAPAVERRPWNAEGFFVHDPEGNRIEIWSPVSRAGDR